MVLVVILVVDRIGGEGVNGLIIDCFAGGGGASVGIEMALGRPVDTAKSLMIQELMEGSDTYLELQDICKKQCCKDCD